MDNWTLVYNEFSPENERLREALCTLGNGYFATRGSLPEASMCETSYPGTYLAGGYNRLTTEVSGRLIENEDLVNMPNWLATSFRIDGGEWFNLKAVEILSYKQVLNLKEGTLSRHVRFRDAYGRETSIEGKRLVHMRYFHLAACQATITPENWSGKIEVRSSLDGRIENGGVERYKDLNSVHLKPIETGCVDGNITYLKVQTNQSFLSVAQAARTKVAINGELVALDCTCTEEEGCVTQYFNVEVSADRPVTFEKVMAMYTSRDKAISEYGLEAVSAVRKAPDFAKLLETHAVVWGSLWRRFDIEIETTSLSKEDRPNPQVILRLHLFHLLQTISHNTIDIDAGVPARGWHGEAYRGHIFWDELFIFPTLNIRLPEITEALLKYRYRRLDRARENAKENGFEGAMYPWQSGSNGREETQKVHLNPKSGRWLPDHSSLQRHVNVAIAYNTWRYYQVTEDIDFLYSHGAEMILEIARFLVSITSYNETHQRYEMLRVMGPDEYHDAYPDSDEAGLNNNSYTNVMTAWVLSRALEILEILPADHRQDLCNLLELSQNEIGLWREISRGMCVIFHQDGVISQFEGYEQLEEFDWEGYTNKYGDIQRLDRILEAEGDTPNRYKLSKQADVLMLFYLFSFEELHSIFQQLGYTLKKEDILKNVNYYMHRTAHGSTLSRIVHSWVMVLADRPRSWELFTDALESDVADIQGGTTAEGIHLGAMAGTVDLVQRCYTGIELHGDMLQLRPCLPDHLKRLKMSLHYRFHAIQLELTSDKVKVRILRSKADKIQVSIRGEIHEIRTGEEKEFSHLEKIVKVRDTVEGNV